jgi:predicted nuclease of predicted toxin-antitoxin system
VPPPYYLDECVDLGLFTRLRQRGYEVRNARDEGMSGVSDGEHLAYSTRNDWLIVSTDTHDYQRLHAIYRS